MNITRVVWGLAIAGSAFASAEVPLKSPPPFAYASGEAVYTDFQSARYELDFDVAQGASTFRSRIRFRLPSAGYPVLDLIGDASAVSLDGESVELASVAAPGGQTQLRVLNKVTSVGEHTLELVHRYRGKDQLYTTSSVAFGIWTSDLQDRSFLEQYLPTSFEYDQHAMELHVRVRGAREEQVLFTNARVEAKADDTWTLRTPETFTSSSLFLHLTPRSSIRQVSTPFTSTTGRSFPITAYAKNTMSDRTLRAFLDNASKHLRELESKFGAWPHPQMLIYAQPEGGGMEYNGATITSAWALGHEIAHSYLGRGFYPANGDAGWLDEAINSWRDYDYFELPDAGRLANTNMAAHGVYVRSTDSRAYGAGANLIAHLHARAKPKGGLHAFLKSFISGNLFRSVYTADFQRAVEAYLGEDLQSLFDETVYGKGGNALEAVGENPYHPKLSAADRRRLL